MSWTDLQIALLRALSAYDRAEFATRMVGDQIPEWWREADRLHNELLKVCIACGFELGGRHRHMSTVQFAKQRAARISCTLHNHVREAGL